MRNTYLCLLLLVLFSCKKEDTPDPPSQTDHVFLSGLPKKIVVTTSGFNVPTPVKTFSLNYDSTQRILSLHQITEYEDGDLNKRLRLQNKYNSDGFITEQEYLPAGYTESVAIIITRNEKNEIRWIAFEDNSHLYYDTSYFTYTHTATGMDIRTISTPSPYEDPMYAENDTAYMNFDKDNNCLHSYYYDNDEGLVNKLNNFFTYNSNGSVKKIISEYVRYYEDEYPATYQDSIFNSVEFLYGNIPPKPGITESMNMLSYGKDFYLFPEMSNTYVYGIMDMITGLPYTLDHHAFSPFRPTEHHYYSFYGGANQFEEQEPTLFFSYENNSGDKLSKLQVKRNGVAVITYEFTY